MWFPDGVNEAGGGPQAEAGAELAKGGTKANPPTMSSRSILVVDDEAELRDVVSRVLMDAGHRVTTAANGQEAIARVAQEEFDLVLTDVIMPERDGMQVITEVRKKQPRAKIVAMSGGGHIPRDQYLKIATGLGAHAILEKPFSNRELVDTIAAVFE